MRNLAGAANIIIFEIASATAFLVAPHMVSAGDLVGAAFQTYYYCLSVIFGGVAIAQFLPMMLGKKVYLERAVRLKE